MGIEGGHAIEDSHPAAARLLRPGRPLYDADALQHQQLGGFLGRHRRPKVKHHNGLTDFGKEVVREMNRLGMMVDISHVADKTFWDALEVSKAPIFASHSSCRALTNHARNMTDDMIVALAKKGGVVQVNFYCGFISQKFRDNDAADTKALDARMAKETAGKNLSEPDKQILTEKLRKEMGLSRATLATWWITSITSARLPGSTRSASVGISTASAARPSGLDDVSKYPNLTRALLEKGYSAEDIRKIYGGNFLRVMRAVEAAAAKMRATFLLVLWFLRSNRLRQDDAGSEDRSRASSAGSVRTPSSLRARGWTNSRKRQFIKRDLANRPVPLIDDFPKQIGLDVPPQGPMGTAADLRWQAEHHSGTRQVRRRGRATHRTPRRDAIRI